MPPSVGIIAQTMDQYQIWLVRLTGIIIENGRLTLRKFDKFTVIDESRPRPHRSNEFFHIKRP